MLPDSAFPPTRFHSSGYSSRSTGDPLQAGRFGAERELHPPRYRPSYRAPPIGFGSAGHPLTLSPLAPHDALSTGLLRTRHRAMGSPHAAGGTRTPFPQPSPRGSPLGPFPGRPTSGPGFPRDDADCSRRGIRPSAAFGATRARISPGTQLTRQSARVGSPPHPRPAPASPR